VVSAVDAAATVQQLGAASYLQKPVDPDALYAALVKLQAPEAGQDPT
jgi:ActR/RegA family two-component response regulator